MDGIDPELVLPKLGPPLPQIDCFDLFTNLFMDYFNFYCNGIWLTVECVGVLFIRRLFNVCIFIYYQRL